MGTSSARLTPGEGSGPANTLDTAPRAGEEGAKALSAAETRLLHAQWQGLRVGSGSGLGSQPRRQALG